VTGNKSLSWFRPEISRPLHDPHNTYHCLFNRLVEDLLTPWYRVLLEKLTGLQLVKKFPAFHGTRRFITALTSVRHLSLSWASSIQSIYPHPTSWRSVLILSTHLRLGLPSGLFPSGFPTKIRFVNLQLSFYFKVTDNCNTRERQYKIETVFIKKSRPHYFHEILL